jgi:hypothetical protein
MQTAFGKCITKELIYDEIYQLYFQMARLQFPYFSKRQLLELPFLDGKTIFERWDELKFFDATY